MASGRDTDSGRFWKAFPLCVALVGLPLLAAILTAHADALARPLGVALLVALGAAAAVALSLAHAHAGRRLAAEHAAHRAELEAALAQEAATDEILRTMVGAAGDVQPVLDAIARNAVRVCDGIYGVVHRFDGGLIDVAAHHNVSATGLEALRQRFPCPPGDSTVTAQAVRDGRVIHVPDVQAPDVPGATRDIFGAWGEWRSLVVVPMLQAGRPLGTINVGRDSPFTARQIQRLGTFAAQAVLAIEDARLVRELQDRNRALTEALEQQTATAEILQVISGSPTDLQPVLEAVVERAARLCEATNASLYRVEANEMRRVARYGPVEVSLRIGETRPITRRSISGRAIVDRALVHSHDLLAEVDREFPEIKANTEREGIRSTLGMPLLREGVAIGAITIYRTEVRPFEDKHIRLLRTFADQAVIAIENVRLFQELGARNRALTEALEQQTATGEILQVISRSPTDVQPVFDSIVGSSLRLCDAQYSSVYRVEGDLLHLAAHSQRPTPELEARLRQSYPRPLTREQLVARAVLDRTVVHVSDTEADPSVSAWSRDWARAFEFRSILVVPMIRADAVIGAIRVARTEPAPFSDSQVALLQTFADQAVIAIENVRLFGELQARNRELTESLDQQTATSEVLKVISRSTFDLEAVLATLIENATRLCGAQRGFIFRAEGGLYHLAAVYNAPPGFREWAGGQSIRRPGDGSVVGRVAVENRVVQILDARADAAWRARHTGAPGPGIDDVRALLGVPMLREGVLIGVFAMWRSEPRPFSDKQIELVTTFADQAVIAIENVRLFRELEERNRALTEALEQQTATGEILRVISSSPTDIQPVFDTIVRSAVRLCDGLHGFVGRFDGELIHFAAQYNYTPEALLMVQRMYPRRPDRKQAAGRAILTGEVVNIADVQADPEYATDLAVAGGWGSILNVPMLREGKPIGTIGVIREQVGRFSDTQVDLLRTFADQAVIAIENVRLFRELQERNRALTEALEQQTATAEILRAISSSPTDVQPVFDAIVASALRLCDGQYSAVYRVEGDQLHLTAHSQTTPEVAARLRREYPRPLMREQLAAQAILDRTILHVSDMLSDPAVSAWSRERARSFGYRSNLVVPMLRGEAVIGAIRVTRSEPTPFSETQIALLQTFADQAVIAIENVRLFRELEARNRALTEALEQQTATGEILRVISSSPTDVQPVLDAVAESATRLCDARDVSIAMVDGDVLKVVASHGPLARWWPEEGIPINRRSVSGRAVVDRQTIHVRDLAAESDDEYPLGKAYQRLGAHRTSLVVPLLREGVAIGVIAMRRGEVRPFTDQQIRLLQTFADQAVIAIENVRLFQELEERNRALTESLEQQTATAEILRAISSSPTDVQPVFDAIVASALRLCGGEYSAVCRVEGGLLHLAAHNQSTPETAARLRQAYPRPLDREHLITRAIVDQAIVHVADVEADPTVVAVARERVRALGYRSVLIVPMVRGGTVIGAIRVARREPVAFSDSQVELLKTFADQAVIAIENVRLFQELQQRNRALTEALDQQTATGEILRVISSSPTDVQPVFEAIVRSAVALCEGVNGAVHRFDGSLIHFVAQHGMTPEALEVNRGVFPRPPNRGSTVSRAVLTRDVVHIDIAADAEYRLQEMVEAGFRTVLTVPMLRDGQPIGAITVTREEGRPFTEQQIALLKTFADQAVIAVENVRLFQALETRNAELTESLQQQTATSDVLKVISRSTFDLQPVLSTLIESAVRLCGAHSGFVYRQDGDVYRLAAACGATPAYIELARKHPMRLNRESATGRVVLDRRVVHIPDIRADAEYKWAGPQTVDDPYPTVLAVPMLRDATVIGVIALLRSEVHPFSDKQIELVTTFADQAVIAIENVRLFRELEERNRALTEALEQQTATSEILQAISGSPTDTQPVFETIAQRAVRLCDASHCMVFRFDGALIHVVAHHGLSPETQAESGRAYPLSLDADTAAARAIRERAVIHLPDLLTDPDTSELVRRWARVGGYRSGIMVPMLRGGRPIGSIGVARSAPDGEPRPFSAQEIALLQTFADQAVIAVENVRLFQELEARTRALARSVEELQALSEVGRAVSSTLDLPTVLATIVARAVQLSGTSGGVVYEYDETAEAFQLRATHLIEESLVEAIRATDLRLGVGATGQAALRRAPVEVVDTLDDQQFQVTPEMRSTLNRLGYRSILGVPLLLERRIMGALTVFRREPGSFPPETVNLLQTFATQSALAIQNARLFREIEAKSRELEVASRHKSQFLANMSHELRTPLNAVLGYTELILDGIYGEVPAKVLEVMARIDQSGRHLLGLINDVLDLSKIEAGQLVLALADYSLREVVHAVVTQVEALAAEKGLALKATVAPDLPTGRGDERRLTQVLLNLVGNAIKFTESGEVRIDAGQRDGAFVVTVADTGPGIAKADRARIFEEFQQADSSSTRRKGGTGLGLSIARRIVELHGGRLKVESAVGKGSTFTFTVPVRAEGPVARA